MPSQPASAPGAPTSLPILPIALIAGIFVFGLDTMHLQLHRNGYMTYIEPLLEKAPRFLPGSQNLIFRDYTGVPALDRWFTATNIFWANVVDLSKPEFTLFAFCFAAQLVPFLLVVMIESQRLAKWSAALNPILWGMLMQAFGFGVIAPIFFLLHIFISSQSSLPETVRLRDPFSLYSVIPAFGLGYFVLSGLMAYPFPTTIHQILTVVWQAFPVFVAVIQWLFSNVAKRTSPGGANVSGPQRDRSALDHAYSFAWNVAVAGQMTTIMVIVATVVFPSIFPEGFAARFTLSSVFTPSTFHSSEYMTSPAVVMHDFFVYDFYAGSAAALVWGVYLLSQVQPELASSEEQIKLAKGVINSTLFAGPGGALVALLQHRDEIVLVNEAKAEKSK